MITDVPHLRIPGLGDALFERVQARLAAARGRVKAAARTNRRADGIVHARMPKFALSAHSPMKVGACLGSNPPAVRRSEPS